MASRTGKLGELSEAAKDNPASGELADYLKSRRWSAMSTLATFGGIFIAGIENRCMRSNMQAMDRIDCCAELLFQSCLSTCNLLLFQNPSDFYGLVIIYIFANDF